MNSRLLLIHALSPIHCGTGQAIGGIDLPIAREKPTNIPLIPGSSIKGVLRAMPQANPQVHREVFGPPVESASDNAGSVQISDANLVFLPVRSIRGTFAWVTSPYMLRRLLRDARECGVVLGAAPPDPAEKEALVTGDRLTAGDKVVFEDLDFTPQNSEPLKQLAAKFAERLFGAAADLADDRRLFVERVCVVHDDVMALLLHTATEVTMRIRLNPDTKTVDAGALWSEEALPIESVLSGIVVATPVLQKGGGVPDSNVLLNYVRDLPGKGAVQLGGKATVGRGLCRLRVEEGRG